MKMKILYTATVLSHICQFHLPYLSMLEEKGHTVHVAAHDNLNEKNGLSLKYASKFFEIPFQRAPFALDNIYAYRQLKTLLLKETYDVIVCNTPMGGVLTRLAAISSRKAGTKVVYIAHGFHFFQGASWKNWIIYYPVEKLLAPLCDRLVTITKEDYMLAKQHFKTDVRHIFGIGASPLRFQPKNSHEVAALRLKENLNENGFLLSCTGELNDNKNQKMLLEAVAQLKDRIPRLTVLFAGNGPRLEALQKQVQALDIEENVRFLGYRTDLEKLIPAVDVVVSCSLREGLPLNILEGMLCEKPIIAVKNRGTKELVDDGQTGFLCNTADVNTLSNMIFTVYQNEELRIEMGIQGFKKAQPYTIDSIKEQLMSILCEEKK